MQKKYHNIFSIYKIICSKCDTYLFVKSWRQFLYQSDILWSDVGRQGPWRSETENIRTDRNRTAFLQNSRQRTESRHTDIGQHFNKILDRGQTESGQKQHQRQSPDRSDRKIHTIRSTVFEMRSSEECDKWWIYYNRWKMNLVVIGAKDTMKQYKSCRNCITVFMTYIRRVCNLWHPPPIHSWKGQSCRKWRNRPS